MAKCDEGYRCDVCGRDVDGIRESGLYLRYVVGLLDPEVLHTASERHLACDPVMAQFIVHDDFPPVSIDGDFDKRQLDPQYVRQREQLLTRGWQRLLELADQEGGSLLEYPLPEVRDRLRRAADAGK